MESSGVLFKFDKKVLKSKSELEAIYFTKPRLVAYYERKYGALEPAKKINYLKKPKPYDYPINLNTPKSKKLSFTITEDLEAELKYAMSSMFKKGVENLKKIKIFISRWSLTDIMLCYYRKIRTSQTVRISRYNSDLYIIFGNEDYYSAYEINEAIQQSQMLQIYELDNNIYTESLYYDPNVNEPNCSKLCGVHQSSFGEFEIIYSGFLKGIQADEEFNDFNDLDALNTCRWVVSYLDYNDKDPLIYLRRWLNAYLSKAADIYLANANSDGIVNEPLVYKHMSELPKEYKSNWRPNICTGYLHNFLQEVNTLMSNDNVNSLRTVYEFYINADKTVTYKIFKDKPETFVVTPEYMEYCKKQSSN